MREGGEERLFQSNCCARLPYINSVAKNSRMCHLYSQRWFRLEWDHCPVLWGVTVKLAYWAPPKLWLHRLWLWSRLLGVLGCLDSPSIRKYGKRTIGVAQGFPMSSPLGSGQRPMSRATTASILRGRPSAQHCEVPIISLPIFDCPEKLPVCYCAGFW